MKLTTIALAFAFALSSTAALAHTNHHKSGHHKSGSMTYQGSYARMQPGMNYGVNNYGWNNNYGRNNYGNPNNRGGLVGGSDAGTYRP